MREIQVSAITDVVERLCIEANTHLPKDVKCAIENCRACEDGSIAQGVLDNIIENYNIADQENVPICQDTGMACVFLEIGQDVHLVGGDLREAVDEGVRRGYTNGYLRKSVVADPIRRGNTGDNTPAMLYTEIVPGENVKITVGPKGFGSENMSMIRMFKPSAGLQGIKDFILEAVETAGPNPCPPMVIGVGIGGTFDKAALLAKKAIMRPLDTHNPDPYYAELEEEMLQKVNALGIGPQGFGGNRCYQEQPQYNCYQQVSRYNSRRRQHMDNCHRPTDLRRTAPIYQDVNRRYSPVFLRCCCPYCGCRLHRHEHSLLCR